MRIIDLTMRIEDGMPTCGTPWHQSVKIKQMGTISDSGRNTYSILLGSHSGTHMDAPRHFIEQGETIDNADLQVACGAVKIVDFRNLNKTQVELEDVKDIDIQERMLFVFGWYKFWKTDRYYKEFPYFSEETIRYLVEHGMKLLALDTPSPDFGNAISSKGDSINHKYLLSNSIIIVEYLCNTDAIDYGKQYILFALPLKIAGSDASPSRVILVEI